VVCTAVVYAGDVTFAHAKMPDGEFSKMVAFQNCLDREWRPLTAAIEQSRSVDELRFYKAASDTAMAACRAAWAAANKGS
jgi:hypothetical protein